MCFLIIAALRRISGEENELATTIFSERQRSELLTPLLFEENKWLISECINTGGCTATNEEFLCL